MPDLTHGNGDNLAHIGSIIVRTRRTLRSSWLATGSALTFGIFLGTVVIGISADLLVPLNVPLRTAALILIVAPTSLALFAGLLRPAARRLSENHIARRIERLVPNMQSRLVTTLDIACGSASATMSAAFRDRLLRETTERVAGFQPKSVVNTSDLKRAALVALVAAAAFALLLVLFGSRIPTTLARLLMPWADIPPATGVKIAADPGTIKLLKGDSVTIAAVIEGHKPAEMAVEYRRPGGRWNRMAMADSNDGQFRTTLEELDRSLEYRLTGGRTWSVRHQIEVIERPQIADMATVVHYPEYMKLPDPQVGPPQSVDVTGPVGSRVAISAEVAGAAATGEILLLKQVGRVREVTDRKERVWFDNKIPDGARSEGNWQWDYGLKFRVAHTEPPAAGQHAHGFVGVPAGFEVRPDDVLYTYVFVMDGQVPEQIMLQFHDGKDWEHRAFWGADKIQLGTLDSPSRLRIGEIPAAGSWVRLEVPAKSIGLEGKRVHGVSFTLFGGQCKWHRAGTVDPATVVEPDFEIQSAVAMTAGDDEKAEQESGVESPVRTESAPGITQQWTGSFTLTEGGYYRLRFRNELGYENKAMREGRITAIPDQPPQVRLDKPAADIVLSKPQKMPMVIHATDDFGLADVSVAVQKGDSGGFVGAPLRQYDDPIRSDIVLGVLDLEPHQLANGEFVRYRVQARDRKGQIAQTKEFVVRIQQDQNAADKELAAADQKQEQLQQKLEELIKQQAKVTGTLEKLTGREQPPETAPSQDDTEPKPNSERAAPPMTPDQKPEMTPAELKQELTKLAAPQDANIQLATQVQSDLSHNAAQAMNSKLIPEPLANQMRLAEQLFQQQAVQPMRELLDSFKQAADPQKAAADPEAIADAAQKLQQQLEAMRDRMASLARAQKNLRDDPAAALAQLRMDLLAQNAEMTAQELSELRDFLDRLTGQMQMLEGREQELAKQTAAAKPVLLGEIDKQQMEIESEAEKLLARADAVLESDQGRDQGNDKDRPDAESKKGDASKESPDETAPIPAEMHGPEKSTMPPDPGDDDSPAGVRPKNAAKKSTPASESSKQSPPAKQSAAQSKSPGKKNAGSPVDQAAEMLRTQLADRQQQTAKELQDSRGQLQSPRDRIAQLLQQIRDAAESGDETAMQQLAELMQSMEMQQAAQLAQAVQRLEQQAADPTAVAKNTQPPGSTTAPPDLNAMIRAGSISDFKANELDIAAQAILLRMPPRAREELLKGMREEGPEAYRKFIEEYFNRLTRVKAP